MNQLVPEQMFSTESNKAQGISAVKALAIASQQGQKIWTITQSNLELALSRIHLSEGAETDIRNAVNAGKIATAHETQINFNGWIGEGYTLIDPNTGAGAYMIAGGGNGAEIFSKGLGFALGMLAIIGMSGGFGAIGFPVLIALALTIALLLIATIISTIIDDEYSFTDSILDIECGFILALSIISAVNFFAKTITGIAALLSNIVGSMFTVAGITKLNTCGGF